MILTITLAEEFGAFCADGEKAARFRFERVDPFVADADRISFDFAGVRNASSSFCNALVANLISQTGGSVVRKLRFANCRENVRAVIEAAVELGLARLQGADAAVCG